MIKPGRIILCEDDRTLLSEAQVMLTTRGYTPFIAKLSNIFAIDYWKRANLTTDDLIVMDLNFKDYTDSKTLEKVTLNYSGLNVLTLLNKEKSQLPGLEQVLVATSLRNQLTSPDLCLDIDQFRVYGLEKAVSGDRKTVNIQSYGQALVATIDAIYAHKVKPINR